MNSFTCDFHRMASVLAISEEKAKKYVARFRGFPLKQMPVEEMDVLIKNIVADGLEKMPVRKAGRPITMKEGFTGDRVSKTVTMDVSTKRLVEKYSKTSTMSGFIEDAVIMYDRILSTGVDGDDVIDLLEKSTRLEKKLEVAERHLQTICMDIQDNAVEEAKNAIMEMSQCV